MWIIYVLFRVCEKTLFIYWEYVLARLETSNKQEALFEHNRIFLVLVAETKKK